MSRNKIEPRRRLLHPVDEPAVVGEGEPVERERGADGVAAEPLKAKPVVLVDPDAGVEGEAVEEGAPAGVERPPRRTRSRGAAREPRRRPPRAPCAKRSNEATRSLPVDARGARDASTTVAARPPSAWARTARRSTAVIAGAAMRAAGGRRYFTFVCLPSSTVVQLPVVALHLP